MHRPAGGPGHHPGAHHEPGVVVDTGQDLALLIVGEEHPTHHVHLPQLHGPPALPALEPAVPPPPGQGVDQPGPLQGPVDAGA